MAFYNRTEEIRRLRRALGSASAKFIVLYGRRRCGKSTLIRQMLTDRDIYYMAAQADEAVQRTQLAAAIAEQIPGFDRVSYPDWEGLFLNLNNSLRQPAVLCLDEFPYLVKSAGSLPSVIQRLIDRKEHLKFHLILCGSSQQMMQGMVLDSSAPLYGRADEILKITPLEAGWLPEHLNCNAAQAVTEYATWGGVPRYWELRKELASYEEAVQELVLDRLGVLHEEPTRLFLDDMRESVQAYSLLALVAGGSNKLSEIAGRLNKPATHLSGLLDRLIQLGYLTREVPFGTSAKITKKSLYKVSDPFMRFYFTFVAPNLSRLALGLTRQVYANVARSLDSFVAGEWENLCRRSIPLLPVEDLSFDQASRWWGNNTQGAPMELDLVAESVDKSSLLVGECKWTASSNPAPLLDELVRKAKLLPDSNGRRIIPALFVKNPAAAKTGEYTVFTPGEVMQRLR